MSYSRGTSSPSLPPAEKLEKSSLSCAARLGSLRAVSSAAAKVMAKIGFLVLINMFKAKSLDILSRPNKGYGMATFPGNSLFEKGREIKDLNHK